MQNEQVAEVFRAVADLLELKGEGYFRIRAYRRAAQVVGEHPEDITSVAEKGELRQLSGIGADLAAKIQEVVQTGTLGYYETIKQEIPPVLADFVSLPGLSPHSAQYLYEHLHIRDLEALEQMVCSHMLRTLPEVDKEAEEKILRALRAKRCA